MLFESNEMTIKRLKAVKSAYILEADSLMTKRMDSAAAGLFIKAAEIELSLVEFFREKNELQNAQISQFSAGSCFYRASQFRRAAAELEQVLEAFPEAREMLAECQGKDDIEVAVTTPGLRALIDLLVKKNVIDEAEWAHVLTAH